MACDVVVYSFLLRWGFQVGVVFARRIPNGTSKGNFPHTLKRNVVLRESVHTLSFGGIYLVVVDIASNWVGCCFTRNIS